MANEKSKDEIASNQSTSDTLNIISQALPKLSIDIAYCWFQEYKHT